MVNHGWRYLVESLGWDFSRSLYYRAFCWFVTFMAVVFSWVFFRAPTLEHAIQISQAMLGLSGFELPSGIIARLGDVGVRLLESGIVPVQGGGSLLIANYTWVLVAAVIALALPNLPQIFHQYGPGLYENERVFSGIRSSRLMQWGYSNRWAFVSAMAAVAGISTLQQVSEFLYFQF
jgi:alginate O-acetyltransferase complex protein AlgI